MSDVTVSMQEAFPSLWRKILVVSCMRLLYQSAMKNIDFYFPHSYLSELHPDVSMTDKEISLLLRALGNWREKIAAFLKTPIVGRGNNYMLIDATHLLSYSQGMEIAKIGYNNQHEFTSQVNMLFIYSATVKIPVYYSIVPGNVREVKAFKLTLQDSGIKDAVVIADKGFYSEGNVTELQREGLQYIIPLRRGWVFITFIALQWYYRIYKLLSEKQLLSKFSPQDLLMHLTEIKKVKINDSWHTSEISSKTQKILDKLNVHIM